MRDTSLCSRQWSAQKTHSSSKYRECQLTAQPQRRPLYHLFWHKISGHLRKRRNTVKIQVMGGAGGQQCLLDMTGLLYSQAHGTCIAYLRSTLDKGSQYSCMELHIWCVCVCLCVYVHEYIYMHIKKKMMNLGDGETVMDLGWFMR